MKRLARKPRSTNCCAIEPTRARHVVDDATGRKS
jgi:hypothetical protein